VATLILSHTETLSYKKENLMDALAKVHLGGNHSSMKVLNGQR